jgi:broad specificity phosphatase PhoE
MEARVASFFDMLHRDHLGKRVLIVTHGGLSKIIKGYFQGIPEGKNYMTISGLNNCEVLKLDYKT